MYVKTIICISCSPSRGRNSDSMLDAFIRGVRTVSGVRAEKLYLEDISLDTYSFENRNGPTSHERAFADLVEKLRYAQGLVLATPTYNFSVPAHLKNFIDRIRFFALDFEEKNKLAQPTGKLGHLYTYFLVSGGTPLWAQKILFFAFPPFWLRGVFVYFGAQYVGARYSGDVETFNNTKILHACERAGIRYAKRVSRGEMKGILSRIFWRPPQQDV